MNISIDQDALSTILSRNSELEAQVKELQEALNRKLTERRGIRYQVHEFHEKFGYPVRFQPTLLLGGEMRFRLSLILEEAFEVLEACVVGMPDVEASVAETKRAALSLGTWPAEDSVSLPLLVDALGDLDYVVEGTRLYLGVNGAEVAAEIHRANMAKDLVVRDGIGKPVKPEGWKPPDIEGVLKKQGWKP